mgnify:CR=1 FL=1
MNECLNHVWNYVDLSNAFVIFNVRYMYASHTVIGIFLYLYEYSNLKDKYNINIGPVFNT